MIQTPTVPRVIALTGGIGSGKSTVARFLAESGAAIIEADHLARDVVATGTPGLAQIVSHFGIEILASDGSLDRKKLGEIIFNDPVARKKVEEVVHPLVRSEWLNRLASLQRAGSHSLIVYAVPLLFESGQSYPELDAVVLVVSPEAERVARIVARDSTSVEEAKQRIAAQLSDDEKMKRSDVVLHNDCSLNELRERVKGLVSRFTSPQ